MERILNILSRRSESEGKGREGSNMHVGEGRNEDEDGMFLVNLSLEREHC